MIGINLQEFCERDPEHRFGLPWVKDGKTYATDGRIAIRMNEASEGCIPHEDKPGDRKPDVDYILKGIESVTEWTDPPTSAECNACGNAYYYEDTCDNCCGTGMCICSCCELEHHCGWCDGVGEGEIVCDCITIYQDRKILNRYADKIRKLTNVKCGVAEPGPDKIVFFTFHGGIGAVMPVYKKSEINPDDLAAVG